MPDTFLPLRETTLATLGHYLIARRKVAEQTDHLFVSLHRRKLSAYVVRTTFHEVCDCVGIGLQTRANTWRWYHNGPIEVAHGERLTMSEQTQPMLFDEQSAPVPELAQPRSLGELRGC